MSEVREVTRRLGELKSTAKALRDNVRSQFSLDSRLREEADFNVQHLAECAAAFRTLPASDKLMAFLDDATVLRLMALAAILGALLTLGISVEVFGSWRC